MGAIKTAADAAWRDYAIDGVSTSGPHEPRKSDIRGVTDAIDTAIANTVANASFIFTTKAAMDAALNHPENTMAIVVGDGANDGTYRKIGASGAGSWSLTDEPTNAQMQADFDAQIAAVETVADAAATGLAFNDGVTGGMVARVAAGPAQLPVDSVELERQGLLAPVAIGSQIVDGYDSEGYRIGRRREDGVKWPAVDGPAPAHGLVDAGGAFAGLDEAGRIHGDLTPAFARMGRQPVSPALPDAAFVVADGEGYALGGVGHDGAPHDIAIMAAQVRTEWLLSNGDVAAPGATGARELVVAYLPTGVRRVLTPWAAGYHWRCARLGYFGKSARAWRQPVAGGAGEWWAVSLSGSGFALPDDPDVLHVVYGDGQSLAQGSQGGTDFPWRGSAFPDHTLTIDNDVLPGDIRLGRDATSLAGTPGTLGAFIPIRAATGVHIGHQLTPLEAFLIAAQARIVRELGRPQRLCGFVVGVGGSTIAHLGVGTQNETNLRAALTHIHGLCLARGWRMNVAGCVWNHGESNATTATATYKTDVLAYRASTAGFLLGLSGQTAPVKWLLSQASSTAEAADDELGEVAIMAFPEMMREAPTEFRVVGAHYPYQSDYVSGDWVHFLNHGYLRLGEQAAVAIDWLFGATGEVPLYPLSAVISGAVITVTWSRPIDVDAALVPSRTFWGVEVSLAANTLATIFSHIVNNGSAVSTVTLSAAPGSLANARLQVGTQGQATPRGAVSVPGTNLRGSVAIGRSEYDDAPIWAFAIHDRIAITISGG